MEVQDAMCATVRSIDASEPPRVAVLMMGEGDVGSLPVLDNGKLVGIVTDRDVTVRAVGNEVSVNRRSSIASRWLQSDARTAANDPRQIEEDDR